MSGNVIVYKRSELYQMLVKDRVLGEAVALHLEMEFLKNPKSNPEFVLTCLIACLEKLGYGVENLHQAPPQLAMQNNHGLYDDGYFIRMNIIKRINHSFKRYTVDINATLGDLFVPTSARSVSRRLGFYC